MKVKASRVIASLLDKNIKDCKISFVQMSSDSYRRYVDTEIYNHDNDIDYRTGKYNVILVDYPPQSCAWPRYITTNELIKIFRMSDKTIDGFICEFKKYIEV